MWKLTPVLRILTRRSAPTVVAFSKRTLLSEAYHCEEAWKRRLEAPIFQNVNLDELYYALDQKFSRDGKASVIDIDVFANAVKEEHYAEELEDLLHKLRLSENTSKTISSTPHAVVRFLLDNEQYESLFRILNDRLNYGVFPDTYCVGLLLDTFIKKEKITEAARLSAIHMLQEDWSSPLVSSLALYACHLYVQNPVPWKEEEVEEDTGEEVKVRVKYIRNPYFDDHFDLRDPQLLVGKTLAAVGSTMNDAVGQTYCLVGLGLYNKWDKAISFLQDILKSDMKPAVFKSGVTLFEETIEKQLNDENDPGEEVRGTLQRHLKELENSGLATNDDLHAAVVAKVEQIVAKEEQNTIKMQEKVYHEWESTRERLLKEQVDEITKQQRLAAVKEEKERLVQKEQELFFFDNEEKYDLILEQQEIEEKEAMKIVKKIKKTKDDDDYIPPEVR